MARRRARDRAAWAAVARAGRGDRCPIVSRGARAPRARPRGGAPARRSRPRRADRLGRARVSALSSSAEIHVIASAATDDDVDWNWLRFPIVDGTTIGSGPDATLRLPAHGVAPLACRFVVERRRWHVVPLERGLQVSTGFVDQRSLPLVERERVYVGDFSFLVMRGPIPPIYQIGIAGPCVTFSPFAKHLAYGLE